ncbi:MAG: chitobiase/beta-hexosaminidase C-terminal domain-containing protein [Prevotella sp.]|nr:chitobiase/beta-hexosaminidase C-terminal domain-containing protein [Prevotella sp.]
MKQNTGTVTATSTTTGSTVYYKWSSSSTAETFTYASYSTDGWTAGTADAATATAPNAEGTYYLNAVAYKDGEASTVSNQAYTIDGTAPTLSSSTPANNATDVAASGNITLTFSENVTIADASKFTLSGGTLGTITASGATVTIPYSGLSNSTQYTLSTAAGAVQDAAGNTNAALSDIAFTTAAAAANPTDPTFTYGGSAQAAGSTISSGVHTGDVVTINVETDKYIYADWSSSDSHDKSYAFTNGKSRAQTTYQATITSGGTRVLYAVAGVNSDGTGASSDLALLTFTGVTPQDPTFSVAEGSVAKNTSLTLTPGYNEDKIYYTYTTDGTTPADPTTSSTLYEGALNLFTADNTTYTIKAISYDKNNANPSAVVTKTYTTPAAAAALTAESSKTWDFTSSSQFAQASSADYTFSSYTVSDNIGIGYNTLLKKETTGSSGKPQRLMLSGNNTSSSSSVSATQESVHFKVAGHTKITVNAVGGSNRNIKIESGSFGNGTALLSTAATSSSRTNFSAYYNGDTETDIYVYESTGNGNITLYSITVEPTYALTKGSETNGTFTLSPSVRAAAGETVTVTTTPASGYEVSSVTTTPSTTVTTVTANSSYTFTMPAEATTVNVTFTEEAAPALAISTQPTGTTYTKDATATALSVAATGGTSPYTYQWYSNSSNSTSGATAIGSATNASYTPSTATEGTTYYYCVVTDNASASVTSNIVAVTVNAASSGNTAANPAVVDKSGTSTYGNKTFLDVANTTSNAELEDGSIDFLSYGAYYLTHTLKPAWLNDNKQGESSSSYSYSNAAKEGFLAVGSASSVTTGYGLVKARSSKQLDFYVTGTSGVAVLIKGASSTKLAQLSVQEVASDGTLTAVGSTATDGQNKVAKLEHGSTLDAAKFYKVTVNASTDDNAEFYQIRFTKSAATTYSVTCATGLSNGTISASPATAAEDATVTITGTPDSGYKLGTVTVTGATSGDNIATSGTGNSRTFTMPAENVYVTATFVALPTSNVTIDGGITNGSLAASSATAQEGSTVTITATPAAGYRLSYITVTDGSNNISVSGSGNTRTFKMPATAVTVSAVFAALPTITITAPSNGTVTTSPASYAEEGATVTITATPNSGYALSAITVTDGNDDAVTVTSNQFTMPSSNVTVTATFVQSQVSAGDRWNFTTMNSSDDAAYTSDANWNSSTSNSRAIYSNAFSASKATDATYTTTAIEQIYGMKFQRVSGGSMSSNNYKIYKPTSASATDGYLSLDASNLAIKLTDLAAGDKLTIYASGSSSKGFTLTNATVTDGGATKVTGTNIETEITVTAAGDVMITTESSGFKIYKIVKGATVDVAEPTFSKADGDGYDGSTDPLSVTVTTNQALGDGTSVTTYWGYGTSSMTRAALVAANNTAAAATVTKATVAEKEIVLSAVTQYVIGGNTYYSEVVTATYPYTGVQTPSVTATNLNIQQGDRRTIEPTITFSDGTVFDPSEYDNKTLSDFFDFTFTKTTSVSAYVTVDGSTGEVNTKVDSNEAPVGTVETIQISASKKSTWNDATDGEWPFNGSGPFTSTVTVTVTAKSSGTHMKFYWDPLYQNEVTSADYTLDGSVSVFNGTIENGRMIYVKPDPGYTIYVAAGIGSTHPTASKVSSNSKKSGVNYYKYTYNTAEDAYPDAPIDYNGIALLIEDSEWESGETEKTFYLSLAPYNASGDPEGSNVKATFTIANDNSKRPADVTLDPATATNPLSTAETVGVSGSEGAYVYGKFSGSSTSYTTPNLINEAGINGGQTSVAVFSTEVAKRKISAVQVAQNTDGYYYIGNQTTLTYTYTFATELDLTSNTLYTNVYDPEGSDPQQTIDLSELIKSITYYNKDSKADVDITTAATKSGSPATQKETVTYSAEFRNSADGTNGSSLSGDVLTIGQNSGTIVVTFTYPGGDYEKTVNKRTGVTAPSKATYTIYLTNPNEQIPNITPASRNFVDEQTVRVQAPDTWKTLYMVVEPGDPNYDATTATYVSSGENKNCYLLEPGAFAMVTLTNTSRVRAFAFDGNASSYTIGDKTTASKEVYETYTKLAALQAPVLSPNGDPHVRTTKSLTVIATLKDAISGLEVYYTTDGTDPTPTTGEKYNGSEKITITAASTTVKAIAYDPATGRISPVTSVVYIYTGNIAQPQFVVTGTGAGTYTSGTVTVDEESVISITSPDGGDIYYTLDGSTPTSSEAKHYETTFVIVKNTTGKAIAVKDDASSPITTVTFELSGDNEDLWEADAETTPSGKMASNDRYVVYGKTDGTVSTKAVKYMTATFGGMDAAGWSNTTIGEKTQGTPLDGVGTYSIRNNNDAMDEQGNEITNNGSAVHENTFKLPAQGDMVRFEPERDGRLTVWLLQQGGLHYNDDAEFCNAFMRLRPVYLFDERGNSIAVSATNGIRSAARLSSNWDELAGTGNWTDINKTQNGVTNKYYTVEQSNQLYTMYSNYLATGNDGDAISAGDPIAPFEVPAGNVKTFLDGTLHITNGHGYVMPSGGFVRYTFDVKGGKSYYLFGYRTKLGVRGFRFKPTTGTETIAKSVTVADATTNMVTDIKAGTTGGTISDDEICNVTYQRGFTNGTWAGVVFPFSVSVAQMKKVFGDAVDIIHFDGVSGTKINFKRHWYPMIVAGTPVLIKPSKDMPAKATGVTFEGVRIEAETVTEVEPSTGDYKMTGTFTPGTINTGDYYISGGNLAYRKSAAISTNACRSWLTPKTTGSARSDLGMFTGDAYGIEDWNVAGNPQPFVASDETVVTYINGVQEDGIISNIFDGPTGIYTINGQLIRKDATSLEGLSKGIYIVNGKKIAIK